MLVYAQEACEIFIQFKEKAREAHSRFANTAQNKPQPRLEQPFIPETQTSNTSQPADQDVYRTPVQGSKCQIKMPGSVAE